MSQRLFLMLLTVVVPVLATGCMNRQPCCRPLLGNITGTRIASPGTGSIAYPQTASSIPYYNTGSTTAAMTPPGISPTVNTAQGWHNAGSIATNTLPVLSGNNSTGTGMVPVNPNTNGNFSTASSTSLLRPGGNIQVAQATTGLPANPNPVAGPGTNGALPLNDATRLNSNQLVPAGQNGIFGRTWEYVSRPVPVNAPQNYASSQPWNGPSPQYPGGNYVNTPWPGYNQGVNNPYATQPGVVAGGWRQQESR